MTKNQWKIVVVKIIQDQIHLIQKVLALQL